MLSMLRSMAGNAYWYIIPFILFIGCSGGSSSDSTPPGEGPSGSGVTLDLRCDPDDVDYNGTVTLSWESNNADACIASGDWSGDKGLTGSEAIASLTSDASFTLNCTGPDGEATDTATVTVNITKTGTATLSWEPPTKNTDGSDLTDLAGYMIYMGTAPNTYTDTIEIKDGTINSYQVKNLDIGTWYFAIAARNAAGRESDKSNEGSKTIEP